jgi:hypothetical protein
MTAVRIFYDLSGGLIAFNRNGTLFLNYRFFEAWRACSYLELHAFLILSTVDDQDVKNGDINQASLQLEVIKSMICPRYFTLAHEMAHNLVQPHNH